MSLNAGQTVGQIALENPQSLRIFESLGIDYCCGGQKPLGEACESARVPVDAVLRQIADAADKAGEPTRDWAKAPIRDLILHIVENHHAYIRRESPRLLTLGEKVVSRHGAGHPELAEIRSVFAGLAQELGTHLDKEEVILFPALVDKGASHCMFGSVAMPISRMIAEHEDAGDLLGRIRELTGGFEVPADACNSWRAFYQGLAEFEQDLHRHIHLENNILFPRAIEIERRGVGCAG